jgi:hypothetical protein
MTSQTPDDDQDTSSFKIADQKILNLLRRLLGKNVCGCCTARALAYHAAFLAEQQMGSTEALEMFEDIMSTMRKRDVPAPSPSTEMH